MQHNHVLATRIRDARIGAGLSQQQVADLLKVNLKTFGSWERYGVVPELRMAKLKQVLPALGAQEGWTVSAEASNGRTAYVRSIPFPTASEETPLAQLHRLRRELARITTELDDCLERLELPKS